MNQHVRHRALAGVGRLVRGQALVEYMVAAAVALMLLAVPLESGDCAVVMFLKAVHLAYHKFLAAVSLPQ